MSKRSKCPYSNENEFCAPSIDVERNFKCNGYEPVGSCQIRLAMKNGADITKYVMDHRTRVENLSVWGSAR